LSVRQRSTRNLAIAQAVKLILLSFDSTLKANLSVGMPLDLLADGADSLSVEHEKRFEKDDAYFAGLSEAWGDALRSGMQSLPDFKF
tara:strand:+ start:304 stop:564 length:261 start_codon:yes stop_codon:yes gene_type:complete